MSQKKNVVLLNLKEESKVTKMSLYNSSSKVKEKLKISSSSSLAMPTIKQIMERSVPLHNV